MLSCCPLYPKDRFVNPPELMNSYNAIKTQDKYGTRGFFPITENVFPELTQDGVFFSFYGRETYFFQSF